MPDVHLLLGYPASGKLTVARALVDELASRGRTARLVDNHLVNNAVFTVIGTDGKSTLPEEVWPLVDQVRDAVLTAIKQLSPPSWDFILTNYLTADEAEDKAPYLARLEHIAQARGGRLIVSCLTCEAAVHVKRIDSADRAARLKATSPDWLGRELTERTPYVPHGAIVHDTTSTRPEDVARAILAVR